MSELSVSVIIPTFNHDRFIGDCLESVLQQSRPAHEVMVVDDGSTDTTPDIVAGFGKRVRYHRQENQGQAVARAWGFQNTSGELVSLLDSDDYWAPNYLAATVPQFARPEIGLAFTNHDRVQADGSVFKADAFREERRWIEAYIDASNPSPWTQLNPTRTRSLYLDRFPHGGSGAIFRRANAHHTPDRRLRRGDDYLFFMDLVLTSHCEVAFTTEVLWHLRTHDSNIRQLGHNFGLLLSSDIQAKKELLRKHGANLQAQEQKLLRDKIADDYFSWAHGSAQDRALWSAYKYYCLAIRNAGIGPISAKSLAGMAKAPLKYFCRR